jgi:hypothetical protein
MNITAVTPAQMVHAAESGDWAAPVSTVRTGADGPLPAREQLNPPNDQSLGEIVAPEAPLTKRETQRRCLAEVPKSYLEAFKRAWAELEPSCKGGRGKHGPRGMTDGMKPPGRKIM